MRLLNTKSLELETFLDAEFPPYIVLSHRWASGETTLQQFEIQAKLLESECSAGVQKIRRFCHHASLQRYDWVWVDTCCIDKTSSAELTESINSMWRWYQWADICYVYLNDVNVASPVWATRSIRKQSLHPGALDQLPDDIATAILNELASSSWFTRGWTLQELLAPKHLMFFDSQWRFMCGRDEQQIKDGLSKIAGIKSEYLGAAHRVKTAPVAERMSWISHRKTSRAEDIAYCLLGLFDVHMPLIYGEGANAFIRLQLEIIAKYDDESIFAWKLHDSRSVPRSGLLADTPTAFAWIFDQRAELECKQWINRAPYRMTNKGIEIQVFDSVHAPRSESSWKMPLNCWIPHKGWVCLEIGSLNDGTFCRVGYDSLSYKKSLKLDPTRPDEFRNRFNIHVRQFDLFKDLDGSLEFRNERTRRKANS